MSSSATTPGVGLRLLPKRDDRPAGVWWAPRLGPGHCLFMDSLDDISRPAPDTLLLKLDDVARELCCTRRSLERQIAARRLSVIHIGRSVRVERSELEDYLARLREQEPTTSDDHHGQAS